MTMYQNFITLGPLKRADGSASFLSQGYEVIGAVNGPIEVQRRDELPEEAAVDVIVRPVAGVGGLRERHLETIVQNALRQIILVSAHPRTLIQVTLQIIEGQGYGNASSGIPQSAINLPILPALLQTATLALLTSSIPLSTTMTSTLIAVDSNGELKSDPSPSQLNDTSSVHVLAFSTAGELLVIESEGDFTFDSWKMVYAMAEQVCRGNKVVKDRGGDIDMEGKAKEVASKEDLLRLAVQDQAMNDQKWK